MSQQTKFKSQLDIEARMIKERRQLLREHASAERHQTKMREYWDIANNPAIPPGHQEFNRQKGYDEKKLMNRNLALARRIENVRLPKLKQALAAFKTRTFEFSNDDRSVVIN